MFILASENAWPFNMTDDEASIIIPTFVSILVFILGLLAKWIYDHLQKRKTIIVSRNVVFEWTELIIDAVKKQSQSLKDLSQRLVVSQSLHPEKYAFSRSMSDKFGELTAEKVVSEFIINNRCVKKVEDKRARYSFNMVSQYDFLTSVESIVKENYEAYNRQANDLREQWNSLILQIQYEIDTVKPETTQDYEVKESIRLMLNNFLRRNKSAETMGDIYNQLVIPLNERISECRRIYPEVRCCQTIYDCARKMSVLYESWLALKKGYAEVFETYASSIDLSLNSLQQAIDYFKNSTKVVCWVK